MIFSYKKMQIKKNKWHEFRLIRKNAPLNSMRYCFFYFFNFAKSLRKSPILPKQSQ